jgi:hypothetical protein
MIDSFYFWVELSALLVCVFCYHRFNITRYKLFLPYLFIIVLYELGNVFKMFGIQKHKSNVWIANFEFLFEYVFYSYFILAVEKNKRVLSGLILMTLGCVAFTLVDIFFIQGIFQLGTFAIILQYSVLITLVCRFFYVKMQDFEHSGSLLSDPDFWVHTGLLFFFLAEFMFFASYAQMAYKKEYTYVFLFKIFTNVALLILYSCFSISFLCFIRTKKISY